MTSNHTDEEDNTIRILVLIHKHVTAVQRKLIEHHLTKLSLSFTQLLNKYGHELYHLCYIKYRCCQCGPIDILPNQRVLTTMDYEILFEKDSSSRIAGHLSKPSRKCCNFAKSIISPSDLDFCLLTKVLLHCCQDLFWQCCLEAKGLTLEQFLNANKHKIYHMWKTHIPCILCENGKVPQPKSLCLSEYSWNCLFVSKTTPLYPSSFTAKRDILISDLDSNLAYSLMSTFCDVIDAMESLRRFRNNLFEKINSAIEKAILIIADVCGQRKEFQNELSNVCTRSSNLSKLQELQFKTDVQEQKMYTIDQNISIMHTEHVEVLTEREEMKRTVHQLKYEQRSWKELKSNEFQLKVTANESKTNIDPSVDYFVKDTPRRRNLSYYYMKEKISDFLSI